MKVELPAVESAVFAFLEQLIGTMPTSGHKFVAGAMLGSSARKLKELVASLADENGYVETDTLREALKHGFAVSGDKVTFTVGDDRIKWLIPPVATTIDRVDLENLVVRIEAVHAR